MSPDLTFPDVPRMRLEELLGQLTAGAQEVLRTQGRLRALLRATALATADLSLPVVQRQIVSAARDLVGAQDAALGVLGPDGSLRKLVRAGSRDLGLALGGVPVAILHSLVPGQEPLRLADVRQHQAAARLAAGEVPAVSFLAVPVRVRGQAFGVIYLIGTERGEFSGEDEQLVTALARSAGIAIENARLFEDSERRRRWQEAGAEATQALVSGRRGEALQEVLRYAYQGARADVAMLLHCQAGVIRVVAAAGELAAGLRGTEAPLGDQLAEALEDGKPVLTHGAADGDGPLGVAGAMMVAPFGRGDETASAIAVARRVADQAFDQADLEQFGIFADQARLARDLDDSRGDREQLAMLRDRDRIAADLHDHVIQELFATGMGLQGLLGHFSGPDQDRLGSYVDKIDATIRRIRSTIFDLQNPAPAVTLSQALTAVAEDERTALGFAPDLHISIPADAAIPEGLGEDVTAVLREALSNAARHAHASTVRADVILAGPELSVQVGDDGIGSADMSRSSGLTNLRRRARKHHGTLELASPPGGGTRLRWTARLPSPDPAA
jgi:two-component system, NarL family, sensor histidine kinase DevS